MSSTTDISSFFFFKKDAIAVAQQGTFLAGDVALNKGISIYYFICNTRKKDSADKYFEVFSIRD